VLGLSPGDGDTGFQPRFGTKRRRPDRFAKFRRLACNIGFLINLFSDNSEHRRNDGAQEKFHSDEVVKSIIMDTSQKFAVSQYVCA
jgi:hypothetical protein